MSHLALDLTTILPQKGESNPNKTLELPHHYDCLAYTHTKQLRVFDAIVLGEGIQVGSPLELKPMSSGSESVYQTRTKMFASVQAGLVDFSVVELVTKEGKGVGDEAILWDFKVELPQRDGTPNFETKIQGIVKDVVAFYNSYGGYLIVGIDDATRQIVGFNRAFDVSVVNQKVQGATGHSVECVYRTVSGNIGRGAGATLGLLFIPRRAATTNPLQFRKGAATDGGGPPAYQKDQFYLRDRDCCRPAVNAEDFEFLFSDRRRTVSEFPALPTSLVENNLPPRDPDLGEFIGRQDELSTLWSWLADPFSPVKLVTGLGGLGKTSLAYTFAERFVYEAPLQFDKLVWLSAKQQTFSPARGGYVLTTRVDFGDVDSCLRELLIEAGCPTEALKDVDTRQELSELLVQHLTSYKYLLIIDDLDTLDDQEQEELYYVLFQILSKSSTKGLMTARRNLGLPRTQYLELLGLTDKEFSSFVTEKSLLLQIAPPAVKGSTEILRFRQVTGGSPLFALSILRLVSLGDDLSKAIAYWAGADGEAVRDAAFKKEVSRLTNPEGRVLLAAIYLGEASQIELSTILKLSRFEIQQALDRLRQFSMVGLASDLPGGVTITVPKPSQ